MCWLRCTARANASEQSLAWGMDCSANGFRATITAQNLRNAAGERRGTSAASNLAPQAMAAEGEHPSAQPISRFSNVRNTRSGKRDIRPASLNIVRANSLSK